MSGDEFNPTFAGLLDLANAQYGGEVLDSTDDFFAAAENLVSAKNPIFRAGEYTDNGKWMDGWESRRRRCPGHDTAIIALGLPGHVKAVEADTAFFTGNYPPYASLQGCWAPGASLQALKETVEWQTLCPQFALGPDRKTFALATDVGPVTHVRLHIYPAGGVARLRTLGTPVSVVVNHVHQDLVALANGGRAVLCSDMHYSPMSNLLKPADASNMGDGWETRRRRSAGFDWVVFALGKPGQLREAQILTHFFKGNYPERCGLDVLYWPDAPIQSLGPDAPWRSVLDGLKLGPHDQFNFAVPSSQVCSHVRLRIEPDGGVARIRLFGEGVGPEYVEDSPLLALINAMTSSEREDAFYRCCASRRWANQMAQQAPFRSHAQLMGMADVIWWHLDETDWKEAFDGHPTIGEESTALREKFAQGAQWSTEEQSGIEGANDETLRALEVDNAAYLARFGYIFIVCATGKSASEMLVILKERLNQTPAYEIRTAAGEQAKITRLRLDKLAPVQGDH